MRKFVYALSVASLIAAGTALLSAQGQGQARGWIQVPDSTIARLEDLGVRAHTNHLIRVDPQFTGTSPSGETPSSIRAVYSVPASGGSNTIVIVDAFDYPTALQDFNAFSAQFGLPTEPSTNAFASTNQVFQVVYANGKQPRSNCGWAQEAALDIEWAHAMAPGAKIVLVEAATNSFANLFAAVDATVGVPNVREISMSWGGSEFSTEASNDYHFQPSIGGIVFFAASGDSGGATIYPGVSPYVVSAGGTRINRDSRGAFVSETAWSNGGGGPSQYEPVPSYQSVVSKIVGSQRGTPDYSFDADPNTGVSVYDSTSCKGMSGWMVFGGTSVSSPSLAGIVNLSATAGGSGFAGTSQAELSRIYQNLGTSNFRDILTGTAGSYSAATGWDFVTGVGSTIGTAGK